MRIAGNFTFEAPREEVWSALNDPEVLARAIPGCQHLDQIGENEFETTLKIGLQAVRGVYHGRVKIDNLVAPESYDLHVDGKGSNGFLKGTGGIKLRTEGDTTILDYGGEAQIGGTIASVGQRLIDGAAKTLINQSLKALAAQIELRRHSISGPVSVEQPPSISVLTPEPSPLIIPEPAHTAISTVEAPASIAAHEPTSTVPESASTFERRKIVVPDHEQLSEIDVARGVINDLVAEQPWLPWVLIAFLIGYILGRRKK